MVIKAVKLFVRLPVLLRKKVTDIRHHIGNIYSRHRSFSQKGLAAASSQNSAPLHHVYQAPHNSTRTAKPSTKSVPKAESGTIYHLVASTFVYKGCTVFLIVYNMYYSVEFFLFGVKIVCVDPVVEVSNSSYDIRGGWLSVYVYGKFIDVSIYHKIEEVYFVILLTL